MLIWHMTGVRSGRLSRIAAAIRSFEVIFSASRPDDTLRFHFRQI